MLAEFGIAIGNEPIKIEDAHRIKPPFISTKDQYGQVRILKKTLKL